MYRNGLPRVVTLLSHVMSVWTHLSTFHPGPPFPHDSEGISAIALFHLDVTICLVSISEKDHVLVSLKDKTIITK